MLSGSYEAVLEFQPDRPLRPLNPYKSYHQDLELEVYSATLYLLVSAPVLFRSVSNAGTIQKK